MHCKVRNYTNASQVEVGEVLIYEEIGYWGIDAKSFAEDIKSLGHVDCISVRINSPGGDVFDGLTIYSILLNHPASVSVVVDGLAASAASAIAMAGDTIEMGERSFMMIHAPWTVAVGNADELKKTVDLLDKIEGSLVDVYASRRKIDQAQIAEWVSQETWFTATEAVESGMADSVVETLAVAAHIDRDRYRNTPKSLLGKQQYQKPAPTWRRNAADREIQLTRYRRSV